MSPPDRQSILVMVVRPREVLAALKRGRTVFVLDSLHLNAGDPRWAARIRRHVAALLQHRVPVALFVDAAAQPATRVVRSALDEHRAVRAPAQSWAGDVTKVVDARELRRLLDVLGLGT
jgi:hypothetical protein